ncbi:MAG: ARF-like GTP-binding protein [Amphiamblys sp. WSBS2006]|nr:MAG: ARF-like GTP-binding protein [Amphiamblys sp. WSBS2006]
MGLLSVMRKQKLEQNCVRVLVLGLDNAGKTTVVRRLLGLGIENISPTAGFEIRSTVCGAFRVDFWDIGGQKSIRPYWQNCFEQTDAVLWVVDSTDSARMEDARRELSVLMSQNRLLFVPLLVMANKQDCAGALPPSSLSTLLPARLKEGQASVAGTSGYTGENVDGAFGLLLEKVRAIRGLPSALISPCL